MSQPARVLARITEQTPWGEPVGRPVVNRAHTPHENAERALTVGPWQQPWPFHCFYCAAEYKVGTHYPYCSTQCGINAEQS